MKKQKEKKYGNPVAKSLNMVTKPVTMKDKKKEQSKTYCRKERKDG